MGSSRLEHSNIKFHFFRVFINCDLLFSKINENYKFFFFGVCLLDITFNSNSWLTFELLISNYEQCGIIFMGPRLQTSTLWTL
jgi:hypothetical protein